MGTEGENEGDAERRGGWGGWGGRGLKRAVGRDIYRICIEIGCIVLRMYVMYISVYFNSFDCSIGWDIVADVRWYGLGLVKRWPMAYLTDASDRDSVA